MYGKGFLGNMTENLQADCVQSRQAGFIQCFLHPLQQRMYEKTCRTVGRQISHEVNVYEETQTHSMARSCRSGAVHAGRHTSAGSRDCICRRQLPDGISGPRHFRHQHRFRHAGQLAVSRQRFGQCRVPAVPEQHAGLHQQRRRIHLLSGRQRQEHRPVSGGHRGKRQSGFHFQLYHDLQSELLSAESGPAHRQRLHLLPQ